VPYKYIYLLTIGINSIGDWDTTYSPSIYPLKNLPHYLTVLLSSVIKIDKFLGLIVHENVWSQAALDYLEEFSGNTSQCY